MATLALNLVVGFGLNLLSAVLFPPKPITGPRLDSLKVTSSTFGEVLPQVFGAENRAAVKLIHASDLRETKNTKTQGGKFGIGGQKSTNYTYDVDAAFAICEGPIIAIGRIWEDGKIFADFRQDISTMAAAAFLWPFVSTDSIAVDDEGQPLNSKNPRFASISIYNGSHTQIADSTLEAASGVGNVQGYRGTAYLVFEKLVVERLPLPNYTFEVIRAWGQMTGDILADMCERAGLAGYYNTRAAIDHVRGFNNDGIGPARDMVADIIAIHDLDVAEIEGVLHFLKRNRLPFARILSDDLGAAEEGSSLDRQRTVSVKSQMALPDQVRVSFSSPERDYQPSTEEARRIGSNAQGQIAISTALVLDPAEARRIAETKLITAWRTRKSFHFTLPHDVLNIAAGEVIQFVDRDGHEFAVWLSRATQRGLTVECEGQIYVVPFTFTRAGANVASTQELVAPATSVLGIIADMAPISASDDSSGIYAAAGALQAAWRGADLYISWDGGTRYSLIDSFPSNSAVGVAATVLADGPTDYLDRLNSLTFTLVSDHYAPASLTDDDFYNYGNVIRVGSEVIQAQTVVANGNRSFTVSNLLRGIYGTEQYAGSHGTSETVVMIDSGDVGRFAIGFHRRGQPYKAKMVPSGIDIATITASNHTYEAIVFKPFKPVHLNAVKDTASGDWTITWIRRTRYDGDWLSLSDVPLNEASEAYEVDIIDPGDGVTVLRTIAATSGTATWTAAQQTIDTGGSSAYCDPVVYQISAKVGRGWPGSIDPMPAPGHVDAIKDGSGNWDMTWTGALYGSGRFEIDQYDVEPPDPNTIVAQTLSATGLSRQWTIADQTAYYGYGATQIWFKIYELHPVSNQRGRATIATFGA